MLFVIMGVVPVGLRLLLADYFLPLASVVPIMQVGVRGKSLTQRH